MHGAGVIMNDGVCCGALSVRCKVLRRDGCLLACVYVVCISRVYMRMGVSVCVRACCVLVFAFVWCMSRGVCVFAGARVYVHATRSRTRKQQHAACGHT